MPFMDIITEHIGNDPFPIPDPGIPIPGSLTACRHDPCSRTWNISITIHRMNLDPPDPWSPDHRGHSAVGIPQFPLTVRKLLRETWPGPKVQYSCTNHGISLQPIIGSSRGHLIRNHRIIMNNFCLGTKSIGQCFNQHVFHNIFHHIR